MKNKNNFCVIMGGGIGSRFWPYSKEKKPKQFLDFMGTGRTLIQMTFDRFSKIIPTENIFVVTNKDYSQLIKEQLPELKESQILKEPMRRNTAPCIAFATYHIKSINPNANIVVAPSDHFILKETTFLSEIEKGLEFVSKNDVLLTLGIKPTRPETGYGYIQIDSKKLENVNKVKTFTEKPNLELAEIFIQNGEFVWNSGIFIWSINSIIKAFEEHLPEIASKFENGNGLLNTNKEDEFIESIFPFFQNISIDYGILEKSDNVYVKSIDIGWSDLGTWGALHDISKKDDSNNVSINCDTLYIESYNNVITTSKKKLVVIQGLDNYIVVESEDTLLICNKEEEQRIKHFLADIKFKFGDNYN